MALSSPGLRILMLVTDAHGGHGGIAQYNRDILEALAAFDSVEEVVVLARVMPNEQVEPPIKIRYRWESACGLGGFIKAVAIEGLIGPRFDLIYCAHINLMPFAVILSRARGTPIMLAIYGIDAWTKSKTLLGRLGTKRIDMVSSISQLTLDPVSYTHLTLPTT